MSVENEAMPYFALSTLLVFSLSSANALSQDKLPTPAEQYQSLLKQVNAGGGGSRMTLSDADQLKFVGQAYQRRFAMGQRFLELAEKYPSDPIALDALMQAVWQVNSTPWPVEMVGQDTARSRAFELIIRDHIRSDNIAALCQRVAYGFCQEYETFLRAVIANNPHQKVQAIARLSLPHYLHHRAQRIELCNADTELARQFAALFGKEYLAELQRQNRDKIIGEVERLLEETARNYGQIELPGGGTVAEQSKADLFEIRHLSVGKQAPNTEGVDEEGKPFSLSDYRGKVILLDFWSYV